MLGSIASPKRPRRAALSAARRSWKFLRGVLESGVAEEARIRGFASPAFAGYAFVEWDDGLVRLHSRVSHRACQDALCPFHDDRPCQNFKRRLGDASRLWSRVEIIATSQPPRVSRGATWRGPPDEPHHVVITGENFHALQLFVYLYEGRVDCIYVDPPYNTGARDWKYNNRYVDDNDSWWHSKWLSMMEKRLRLAKRLLRPDGVLICTIDEHEVNHLGNALGENLS